MATELSDGKLKVKRELEAGWFQWVSLTLPASISIQSGINTPRYPSLKGIMGAKKKEIRSVAAESGTEPAQSISKVYIPQKTKRTEMIEGTVDQQVERLVDVLKKDIRVV
jgi:electron transfer flavoprotein beta subunit